VVTKPDRPKAYDAALELQEIALRDCRNAETKPHIRAALMRAWCDLEERKRILRMKPLPKSVDVSNGRQRKPTAGLPAFLDMPQAQAEQPPAKSSAA
jgi:hypothetical protein